MKLLSIMMIWSENCMHLVLQYITSKNKKEVRILKETAFKCLSAVFQERKIDLE